MAGLFEFLFGSGGQLKQVPTMTKEQKGFLSQIFQQLGGMQAPGGTYGLAQQRLQEQLMGGNEAYNAFAAPYLRQFQEEIVPGLAERFAGAGALSSSGFAQALGGAGAGLQERLASLRAQQQQGAIGSALGLYTNLAGKALGAEPYGYVSTPAQKGIFPFLQGGFQGLSSGGYGGLAGLFGFGGR